MDRDNDLLTLLTGLGIGAGLMFILDPDRGRRRRALARDKAIHYQHKLAAAAYATARDVSHRLQGVVAETRGRLQDAEVSDDILVDRVRSAVGRYCSHSHALQVRSQDGRVTLAGPVLAWEVPRILLAAGKVRGVRALVNEMQVRAEAGNLPSLQGAGFVAAPTFLRASWPPAARLFAGALGTSAALTGLRRGSATGALFGTLGMVLAARALTNVSPTAVPRIAERLDAWRGNGAGMREAM